MATDQPDFADGVMLALYPDPALAADLAVPGGLAPEELHVTVAYVGKVDQIDPARLRNAAEVAARRTPITARISGHARFTGGPKGDVIVALIDSADLEQLRRAVVDALTEQGIAVPAEHGFTAHMTLQYLDPTDADPVGRLDAQPTLFPYLAVVHGADRTELPFDDGLASLAREAYAIGWAASGGPMTDRVRAGSLAAVDMALANRDQPGILEATLHLGHLEGVWAAIFERRLKVHADNEAKLKAAWAKLDLDQYAERIVRSYRRRHGITEAAAADEQWLTALTQQLATEGMSDAEIADIKATIEDAIRTAAAEGQVGALALSADKIGQVGFDFNLAFDTAYAALADAENLLGADKTSEWLSTLLGDEANEVGSTLARLARDGASAEEMTTAVEGILSGADSRALLLGTDVLTSRAMSQGALDLYRSEGLEMVDFVTAGDQRVCTDGPNCAAVEQDSPYPLAQAPVPGLHPLCRCTLAPTVPLPGESIDRFLAGAGDLEDEELAADAIAAAEPAPAAKTPEERAATRAAARERHRQIAAREPVAKLAADLDQTVRTLAGREVDRDAKTVLRQAVATARQSGLSEEALAGISAAIEDGDLEQVRALAEQLADEQGLTPIGRAGEVVEYDPALHEPIADEVNFEPGDRVQVWRQGHTLTLEDGSTVRLDRAVVRSVDETAAGAAVPADAAPYHLSLDGIEDLARTVADAADGTVETLTGGSAGDTYKVTLPDGRIIVHKGARTNNAARAKRMADGEQAASLIGRALGLRVPAIYRNEADAVWMEYIDAPSVQSLLNEARIADLTSGGAGSEEAEEALKDRLQLAIDTDAGNVAGLFDLMIANHDRHIGNWIIEGGEPALIDHGNAFSPMWIQGRIEPPFVHMDGEQLFLTTTQGPFAGHFVDGEIDTQATSWVENNLTPVDIAEVRARLAGLAGEFDLLGLTDWLDYAGRVLDAIEPYATGTRNLIAEEGA